MTQKPRHPTNPKVQAPQGRRGPTAEPSGVARTALTLRCLPRPLEARAPYAQAAGRLWRSSPGAPSLRRQTALPRSVRRCTARAPEPGLAFPAPRARGRAVPFGGGRLQCCACAETASRHSPGDTRGPAEERHSDSRVLTGADPRGFGGLGGSSSDDSKTPNRMCRLKRRQTRAREALGALPSASK